LNVCFPRDSRLLNFQLFFVYDELEYHILNDVKIENNSVKLLKCNSFLILSFSKVNLEAEQRFKCPQSLVPHCLCFLSEFDCSMDFKCNFYF
jgi:hypothetical protein